MQDFGGTLPNSGVNGGKNAWELFQDEKERKKIGTSCEELDAILGGGICPKEVSEICGVPGIGKTQLGMQLAINVQIPHKLGGLGGHAVYIDTEGSFMVERASQMAEACIAQLLLVTSTELGMDLQLSVDDFLSHIHLFRVHDPSEQLAVINTLPIFLKEHTQVKLIVFDSVTFHFRQDFDDLAGRTRLMADMAQKLRVIAEEFNLAIVVTNQITYRVTSEGAKTVPALGETWSHACTNRVMMCWVDGQRYAHLVKSSSLQQATALYTITGDGIRSAHESNKRPKMAELRLLS